MKVGYNGIEKKNVCFGGFGCCLLTLANVDFVAKRLLLFCSLPLLQLNRLNQPAITLIRWGHTQEQTKTRRQREDAELQLLLFRFRMFCFISATELGTEESVSR